MPSARSCGGGTLGLRAVCREMAEAMLSGESAPASSASRMSCFTGMMMRGMPAARLPPGGLLLQPREASSRQGLPPRLKLE
eukprot:scaffold28775_cov101-Isochrysis_galbana.AAC.3